MFASKWAGNECPVKEGKDRADDIMGVVVQETWSVQRVSRLWSKSWPEPHCNSSYRKKPPLNTSLLQAKAGDTLSVGGGQVLN